MGREKVGGQMKPIYLDNAASTPVRPRVLAKFVEIADSLYGNPSSKHIEGINAYEEVSHTKDKIAEFLSCASDEIYFTSGATMSNNILIQGMFRKHPETMLIISNVEHNDIMELYNWLPYTKRIVPVNKSGIIDLAILDNLINECKETGRYSLVSVQLANSETGIIQPVREISEIVHKHDKAFFHSDATQYIPYYPVNMDEMGIDALSMSGQKINGLKGSGILALRRDMQEHVAPIIFGEQGLIGGTPATPLISSLGIAFEEINYNVTELQHKRDVLLDYLIHIGGVLVGTKNNRLPNNIYIRFPGISGLSLVNLLNDYHISIGTGSACSTDSDRPSHVAMAYGLTPEEALECVRFTLSNSITYEEIEYVAKVVKTLISLV